MFYPDKDNSEAARQKFQAAFDTMSSMFTRTYCGDNLITFNRNVSFMEDLDFVKAFQLEAGHNPQHHSLMWRVHVALWAARQALRCEGDFVECGVLEGFTSRCLCHMLQFGELDRTFWLYDTFSGLPEKYSTDTELAIWNVQYHLPRYENLYEKVVEMFSAYPNARIVRGILPDTLEQAAPEKIAFMHIDLNSEQAEMGVLTRLYERIVPGGVILLDDFGWMTNRAQMVSERAFFQQHGLMVMELPTGQGLVIKH
ncbi:TylF/MycF/NovP-related O-methyltransferase [Parachitinimonas caeni]|uniref:TylF/MycF/NovP-related O-methyltransferase n=1 Tax=Parachitinimonas caeni TaxID=3031301 RepID=A0ABT7DZ42_9NEIS|nr:TylF/MycF/NovP-related O-methyltransferase [Parachitinimonas caeni]MDK2124343.1 TylF/MycF/NovP-related O-methyltransferase [Parachitinimonas caeni]